MAGLRAAQAPSPQSGVLDAMYSYKCVPFVSADPHLPARIPKLKPWLVALSNLCIDPGSGHWMHFRNWPGSETFLDGG